MLITGPVSPGPGFNLRPASQAVNIVDVNCPDKVKISASTLENHTEGVDILDSSCLTIVRNTIHDNNSDPLPCRGINGVNVDDSVIRGNLITTNGENLGGDAGVRLVGGSTGNTIANNDIDLNNGDGLVITAPGNIIRGNSITGNGVPFPGVFFDYTETLINGAFDNTFKNNVVVTILI